MNRDFARQLIELNNRFYQSHASSFSETRQAPWPGWVRTFDTVLRTFADVESTDAFCVFDLACGNMRFEHFLSKQFENARQTESQTRWPCARPSSTVSTLVVTSQSTAAATRWKIPHLHFQELDVLQALMQLNPANTCEGLFDAPLADLSVCFGFMHHVPSSEFRVRVLDALVRQTRRAESSSSVSGNS